MNVYYRGVDKKLRCLQTAEESDVKEVIAATMEYLHQTGEVFYKPILCLVQGGKKG